MWAGTVVARLDASQQQAGDISCGVAPSTYLAVTVKLRGDPETARGLVRRASQAAPKAVERRIVPRAGLLAMFQCPAPPRSVSGSSHAYRQLGAHPPPGSAFRVVPNDNSSYVQAWRSTERRIAEPNLPQMPAGQHTKSVNGLVRTAAHRLHTAARDPT